MRDSTIEAWSTLLLETVRRGQPGEASIADAIGGGVLLACGAEALHCCSALSGAAMTEPNPLADYTAYLREGRFMIQRSLATGRHVFYPRVMAPGTGESDLEWVAASGLGTVYSTTVVRQRPPSPSYNVALIDLAEGCRMMSRVEGVNPEDVRIGMAVRARVALQDGEPLIVFDPA